MKRKLRVIALFGCIIVGIFAAGNAGAYTFDMGSGSTVDTSGTNGVLRMDVVEVNPNLDHIFFDLGVG